MESNPSENYSEELGCIIISEGDKVVRIEFAETSGPSAANVFEAIRKNFPDVPMENLRISSLTGDGEGLTIELKV